MTGIDWGIAFIALVLIIAVNWYFLGSRRAAVAASPTSAGQAITIRIQGGYSPDHIEVERGKPVRLTFDRQEDNPCSEEVVLPAFNIRRTLPAFRQTVVEFTPAEAGEFEFKCGMGMLHGSITVAGQPFDHSRRAPL
jgi:plastocyanin domain-containing protein